jgi:hypothetical protein
MSVPIGLADLADYAAIMAADLDNPLIERDLWAGIALEITTYMTDEDEPMLDLTGEPR